MRESWIWVARYAVVVFVALVLATVLGATDLFRNTRLIAEGLSASHLVRFLGYGTSLVVLWLAAWRAMTQFRDMGAAWHLAEVVVVPIATLLVVASGHGVLLLMLGALMGKAMRVAFDWIFILGIVASAGWLLFALFNVGVTRGDPDAVEPGAMESGTRVNG